MGISDKIETFITELLKDGDDVEIGRNELAAIFNCVPSQINYVISTRFSPQRGFVVESKRGGGGFLKIRKIEITDDMSYVMKVIGDEIGFSDMKALLEYLYSHKSLSAREVNLILTGLSDKSLSACREAKNKVRASSLKNMLINI